MKLVINTCYGGFGLSEKAFELYTTLKSSAPEYSCEFDRNDPILIEVVETLGEEASDEYSHLEIVEIPDESTDCIIDEYDGIESVMYVLNGKIKYA